MHPRADDGIRTRDPHLGKVMRYQLRYIRAQRARSSPGAKHDDSPPEWARTTCLVPSGASLSAACAARSAGVPARDNLRRRSPLGAGPVAQWESVRFTRGRSLVRSQPGPHLLSQAGYGVQPCEARPVLFRCYPALWFSAQHRAGGIANDHHQLRRHSRARRRH